MEEGGFIKLHPQEAIGNQQLMEKHTATLIKHRDTHKHACTHNETREACWKDMIQERRRKREVSGVSMKMIKNRCIYAWDSQ